MLISCVIKARGRINSSKVSLVYSHRVKAKATEKAETCITSFHVASIFSNLTLLGVNKHGFLARGAIINQT